MSLNSQKPVLILGAGINGCAVARELILNGVPVCLVDRHDIAFGASSRSSRLIHGGLRYLEHGEFRLVRESLEERTRLRKLAPQFVRPFSLHIPVAKRTGGLIRSGLKFLTRNRFGSNGHSPRGLWLVRMGLGIYDRFVSDPAFPNSRVLSLRDPDVPQVDPQKFRWVCRYTDAQMLFPERFVLSMLTDAQQLAQAKGIPFSVWTGHEVRREKPNSQWEVVDCETNVVSESLEPALIINATGAWGDLTLKELSIETPPLFGGTKGSHLVTHQPKLCQAVGEHGVYAEADDGRLVFVLPFAGGVMVGTTDERFEGNPATAVASEAELTYLIEMINDLFPQVHFTKSDIEMHCAGVRPLPKTGSGSTNAISRDHSLHETETDAVPVFTLVGGKLTTARAFGESITDAVLSRLNRPRTENTQTRIFPGGENYPNEDQLSKTWKEFAKQFQRPIAQIQAMWILCGTRVKTFLESEDATDPTPILGTHLPRDFVRWIIQTEWVRGLEDLIERRLMLIYHPNLSRVSLDQLAELLIETEVISKEQAEEKIQSAITRFAAIYGKQISPAATQLESETPRSPL